MQRAMLTFTAAAAIACAPHTSFAVQTSTAHPARPPLVHERPATRTPPAQRKGPVRKAPARQATRPRLSPVQLTLQRDATLAEAVLSRLPSDANLMEVSAGYDDLGEFVAAVTVSRALGIPMRELRRRMVGDGMPLLLAIQDLRPKSNYRSAARRAEEEAATMLSGHSAATLTLANRRH